MIKSISLKNFRKHKDLTVDFSDGITVIRADNEAGKSSLFEAILYALFGIKACRNSDIATWGESPNSCKVTLAFEAGGKEITVTRSPRSAEAVTEGRRVSGQSEVSRFCESMLDIKQGIGSKLMFASQGDMRGILEDTGGSSIKLMEQLTGLDDIDTWADTLQTHFNTGRTEVVEQMLQEARRRLDEAQTELGEVGDPTVKAEQLRAELIRQYREWKHKAELLKQKETELSAQYESAQAEYKACQDLKYRICEIKANMDALQRVITAAVPEAVDESALEQEVIRTKDALRLAEDYATLAGYHPDDYFNGSKQQLEESLAQAARKSDILKEKLADLNAKLKIAQSAMTYTLECPTCHRAWDDADQRKSHNKAQSRESARLQHEIREAGTDYKEAEAEWTRLNALYTYRVPNLSDGPHWALSDETTYPPKFVWTGGRPEDVGSNRLKEAERTLSEARMQNKLRVSALESAEKATAEHTVYLKQYEALTLQLPKTEPEQPLHLAAELQDLRRDLQEAESAFAEVKGKLDDIKGQTEVFYTSYERAKSKVVQAQSEAEQAEATLNDYRLNNALLKYLRSAKPQITDKVWQSVCTLAGKYFSMMRGSDSTVEKTSDGFKVNGSRVSSLSGSTLDILGIATRTALTKTFVPGGRMMFLDEPFAACDAQRQAQMLAFICSAGFQQIVVVTHEDATEAAADQIIAL